MEVSGFGSPLCDPASLSAAANERALQSTAALPSHEAAHKFEALFATMLVREMRKALPDGFFGSEADGDIYGGWLDQHLGQAIARRGDLHLAPMNREEPGQSTARRRERTVVKPKQLLKDLEAYLADELAARARLSEIVARQEHAVLHGKSRDLEVATREVEAELASQIQRTARRQAIFATFAALWRVSPDVLTLSSIAERIGAGSENLRELRTQLRDASAGLAKKNRRLAALTASYRRVLQDVIETLVGAEGGAPLRHAGTLVDARV